LTYNGNVLSGDICPTYFKQFLDVLLLWHGSNSVCVVSELISLPGCTTQKKHKDMVYPFNKGQKRKFFLDIPYSMSIALEDNNNNRTAIINDKNNEVLIQKGRVACWRGNYKHAGASYTTYNSRLHIAVCNHDKLSYLNNVYNIDM